MPKQKKAKKSKRSSGEEIYSVEKILSKRIVDGKVHYFLKWFGYPESENTWEPEENLNCPVLISDFEKQYANRAGSDSEDKEPQKRSSDTEKPAAPKNPDSTTSEKKSVKKKLKLMTSSSNANGSSPASAPPPTSDGTDSEIPPLSGFAKGWEAEEILGATEENGQILFLIKWFVDLLLAIAVCSSSCADLAVSI